MSIGNFGKTMFRAYVIVVVLATIFLVAPRDVEAQDCGQWTRIASPNAAADATFLGGVSGIADDDVWSVGWYRMEHPSDYDEFPYALHWDGQQWNSVFVPEPPIGLDHKTRLYDVTAVSENEVWTVGTYIPPENVNAIETLAMQWNGDQWAVIPSPTAQIGSGSSFYAIDSKDGEIWAVGSSLGSAGRDNLAARWNGSGWDEFYPVRINNGDHEFSSVHIHSDSVVFAAGGVGPLSIPYVARWDGSSWSEVLPRIDSDFYLGLTSIISFGPNDIWVGASRTENFQFQYFVYLHFDGNSWTEYPVVHPFHVPNFEGDDPNNFYSGGLGTLAKFNGKAWELVDSLAVDVWTISDITVLPSGTVVGSGNTYDTGSPETLTARYVPCSSGAKVPPIEFNIYRGQLMAGAIEDILESDDSYLVVNPGIVLSNVEPPVWVEFIAETKHAGPDALSINIESRVNTSGLELSIEAFNYVTEQYESVGTQTVSLQDTVVSIELPGDPARFVDSDTGQMHCRVGCRATGLVFLYPWSLRIDQVYWNVF